MRELAASGKFWMWVWTGLGIQFLAHLPLVWWTPVGQSLRYLNTISVVALVLSCGAAAQASLSMRKADPEDPL
jgi:hypothetical protein